MRTALACYSLAVLAVLATALLKGPIEAHFGYGPPFILFLPAVTLGAWYGGLGPGLLATILATMICAYFFLPPIGSLKVSSGNDLFRLVLFVLEGTLTSVLMEQLHAARRLSVACAAEAERHRRHSRRTEEQLQALLNHATTVIFLKDAESRYLLVNHQFVLACGVPGESILGQTDFDLFPRERAEQLQAQDHAVLETGRAMQWENVIAHADGPRTYLTTKFPVRDGDGVSCAVGGFATDITELKHAQWRALQAERRRLRWCASASQFASLGLASEHVPPIIADFSCISHPKSLFFTIFPPSSQRLGDWLRSNRCGLLSPRSTPRSSSYDDHPRRQATLRLGLPGR